MLIHVILFLSSSYGHCQVNSSMKMAPHLQTVADVYLVVSK